MIPIHGTSSPLAKKKIDENKIKIIIILLLLIFDIKCLNIALPPYLETEDLVIFPL